jgi:hypothetical protein
VRIKFLGSLLLMVLSFALIARCVAAQDEDNNSFTGTLIENTPDHLKVSRPSAVQGKTEARVFKVTAQTKIEGGRLKLKQRIYVRYVSADEMDTAILVIIRPSSKKTK